MKRLQNTVSESRMALPCTAAYAICIWLLAGLLQGNWWIQFAIFAVCTYLMVELNNANALLRIYSRMVSCTFVVLSCLLLMIHGSEKTDLLFVNSERIFHCKNRAHHL